MLNYIKQIDETNNEQSMKMFGLFVNAVTIYIKSYFQNEKDFYKKMISF